MIRWSWTLYGTTLITMSTLGVADTHTELQAPMSTDLPLNSVQEIHATGDFSVVLSDLRQKKKSLEQELQHVQEERVTLRDRILARSKLYVRKVRAGYLPVGGGFDALVDHAQRMTKLRSELEADIQKEQEDGKRVTAIEREKSSLEEQLKPLEVQQQAIQKAQRMLREADERKTAFDRAFGSKEAPSSMAIYAADAAHSYVDQAGSFSTLKGKLVVPIAGRAVIRRVHLRNASDPGLEFTVSGTSDVRAAGSGIVAFANEYSSIGQTVIVDHGEGYYSLYGGLATIVASVGTAVSAGSKIATIAPEHGNSALLYFEMRRGSETIESGEWLGLAQ